MQQENKSNQFSINNNDKEIKSENKNEITNGKEKEVKKDDNFRLTIDYMMIVGKYFESNNDFINTMKINHRYQELVSMYYFNPISDTTLFENLETQHFYNENDLNNQLQDKFRYINWTRNYFYSEKGNLVNKITGFNILIAKVFVKNKRQELKTTGVLIIPNKLDEDLIEEVNSYLNDKIYKYLNQTINDVIRDDDSDGDAYFDFDNSSAEENNFISDYEDEEYEYNQIENNQIENIERNEIENIENNELIEIIENNQAIIENEGIVNNDIHVDDENNNINRDYKKRYIIENNEFHYLASYSLYGLSYCYNLDLYAHLRELHLPDSIRLIESKAISNLPSLTVLYLPNNKDLVLSDYAIKGCEKLSCIYLPPKIKMTENSFYRTSICLLYAYHYFSEDELKEFLTDTIYKFTNVTTTYINYNDDGNIINKPSIRFIFKVTDDNVNYLNTIPVYRNIPGIYKMENIVLAKMINIEGDIFVIQIYAVKDVKSRVYGPFLIQ